MFRKICKALFRILITAVIWIFSGFIFPVISICIGIYCFAMAIVWLETFFLIFALLFIGAGIVIAFAIDFLFYDGRGWYIAKEKAIKFIEEEE